ncbi:MULTISPECIES: flagellar assembly protein A [unclassified Clostridium]|uniref:flagellar assembly protein A n=1 Tax=unclassified Clostridium TaxID=2614128 RepID=UPI001898F268|nr:MULTISPECIES: flagellar assembly protein A [unclassified Clostridium]
MEENYNKVNNIDGTVYVKDRKIVIRNPVGNGKYATILPPINGELYINGEKVTKQSIIKAVDIIDFKGLKEKAQRLIDIRFNDDKTEAYISITYNKELVYYLKDSKESNILSLDVDVEEGIDAPIITESELFTLLKDKGISYGIDNEIIKYIVSNREIENKLIAQGIKEKLPIEDKINVFFNSNNKLEIDENTEKIDYREFNSITSVKANEVLAEIIKGENGVDGKNVFSQRIPGKAKKKSNFSAGQGCKIKDNLIISTISGKPYFSKNTIGVEPIYVLNDDVTILSGNIKFPSSVQINGKVTEGMKVTAGGSLAIKNGVFGGFIDAKDTSEITGNIVNSKVEVGGTNLIKEKRVKALKEIKNDLESLLKNSIYLKDNNLIKSNITDGMIIKSLIETKYKNIPKTCIKIISNAMQDNCYNSIVVELAKSKLMGAGPSTIKDINEIENIIYQVAKELEDLEKDVITTSDLTIEYAQESEISVTGDINIIGKGLFTSQLNSSGNINFCLKSSVCRGGHLKSGKLIKASIVGSDSGVFTKLEVDKDGEINVDVAYHNTIFIIGNKKYILEKPSKNVHAYIDKDGSLIVDKLLL